MAVILDFFSVLDLFANLLETKGPLPGNMPLLHIHNFCIQLQGVQTPLALFMGLFGVLVSGSTLTWLESGSGGEWVRFETERMKLDLEEPHPGLGTKSLLPKALSLFPSLPTWGPLQACPLTCPGSQSWSGSGC